MSSVKLNEIYQEVLSDDYQVLWSHLNKGKPSIVSIEIEEPYFSDEKQKFERVAILSISPKGYVRFGTPGMGYGPIKFEDYDDFKRHMIYYKLRWIKPK